LEFREVHTCPTLWAINGRPTVGMISERLGAHQYNASRDVLAAAAVVASATSGHVAGAVGPDTLSGNAHSTPS
jgi:hypothetical protein